MTSSGWRIVTGAGERRRAWLGLGGNLGDRESMLRRAVAALARLGRVEAVSGIYESEPVGIADQPEFLNIAVRLATALPAEELLAAVKTIERGLGRTPGVRMGPRLIDIDLLLLEGEQVRRAGLTVPHRGLMDRAFVLLPLVELDPELTDPATGERLSERLRRPPPLERVRRLRDWQDATEGSNG
jgi:2-amino-4-hydroxy-6-hydroxymethyldihydropteridine diphosphokinase